MSSVTLSSLSLAYPGGHLGLADVDLSIRDGEFVALVGPSGSGKTTLLRAVAGFVTPTSGTVRIGDALLASPGHSTEPERRGLGMVFQQHAVWPHWTVGRNVEYPLRRAGVERAERRRRVAEALELVGLGGMERRNPATLSGGQRQRVAIARAVIGRPRVLLLDEALSALDEPLRDRLRLELRALTRSLGLTVLHVTHDRGEALALADRVAVLDGGRLQQFGTPAELLEAPASPFVARFVSDAALVRGSIDASGFRAAGHALRVPAGRLVHGGRRSSAGAPPAHGEAEIAIRPEHLLARPDPAGPGLVTSSLFGRDGDELVVEWAGLALRSRASGVRCAEGTRVSLSVEHATVFPAPSAREAGAGAGPLPDGAQGADPDPAGTAERGGSGPGGPAGDGLARHGAAVDTLER